MALPHIIPLVPILQHDPFDHPDFIYEPMYDGFRGVLYIDGDISFFRSKKDKLLGKFDGLADKIRQELKVTSAIIDGEITVLDPRTGYSDFRALLRHQGTPVFMAFDLLWVGGHNLTSLKLIERKQYLRALIRSEEGWVRFVDFVDRKGIKFMHQIMAAGLEGMVAKEKHGIYTRSTRWLKILNPVLKNERHAPAKVLNRLRSKQKA